MNLDAARKVKEEDRRSRSKYLDGLVGQPVAFLCARYWYRGMLVEVGDDFVVLENARAVETTGKASDSKPNVEDPIPSQLMISMMALEIVCQPAWVWHEMPVKK